MPENKLEQHLISVIMSVYNEEEGILSQAVESILHQTYSTLEFIILLDKPDNLSALRVLEGYRQKDNRLRILVNDKNMGLTKSLNKGIDAATGRYIARMDADDISSLTRLSDQLNFLETRNLDLIGGQMEYITEDGRSIMKVNRLPLDNEAVLKKIRFNNVLAHPSYFGKKEVFTSLEGYRNIHTCEDYDFVLRALAKGYRLGNCDRIVLRYRVTENSISRKNGLKQYMTSRHLVSRYRLNTLLEEGLDEDLEFTLKRKVSERSENAFNQASQDFNRGLGIMKEKRYVKGLLLMLKGTFSSPHYFQKLVQLTLINI